MTIKTELMYEELKTTIIDLLARSRPLKPQTERQLSRYMTEHSAELYMFLRDAAKDLEEHEIEILFGPQFTPDVQDQADVSQILNHWKPTSEEMAQLVCDICEELRFTTVQLPGDVEAKLTLHEVMVERFVRLLHLERAPEPQVSAAIRDALPCDLWPFALAMLRQRGFTPPRQEWFARFVCFMVSRHCVTREQLADASEFIADQLSLDSISLVSAIQALVRAARDSVTFAQKGRTYWSPDVAQHHHYRGQGQVNEDLVRNRREDEKRLQIIADDLEAFGQATRHEVDG